MKAVCLSIIVYLVLFSTQLCQDTMAACVDEPDITSQSTVLQDSPDSESCPDECPQTCACTCCAHPVVSRSFNVATPLIGAENAHTDSVPVYTEPFTDTFNHSIWQPPKV